MAETTHADMVERFAILICFAEFSMPQNKTPEEYWVLVSDEHKALYRRDGRHFLAAVRGRDWQLVPCAETPDIATAILGAGAGVRSLNGVARLWREALKAAPNYRMVEVDPTSTAAR